MHMKTRRMTIAVALLVCAVSPSSAAASKPNVLLIAVDDLNDWIGCMGGHPDTKTPNIDKLASRGVMFTNAHCQGTMCNPSRISIMWGLRPSTTGFYSNRIPARAFPGFLRKNTTGLPLRSRRLQNANRRQDLPWLVGAAEGF